MVTRTRHVHCLSCLLLSSQKLDVRLMIGLSFSAVLFSAFNSAANVMLHEHPHLLTHSLTHLYSRHYNPCRVLADSRSRLQPSQSLTLLLQFLTPSLSASLITPSIHLRFGLPTRLMPSGLSKVIFLHGRLSCIRTICPAHLSLVIVTVVTKSVSSYR